MRLWPWVLVWVWLAALGAIETAPRPKRATASALGTESPRFLDRPDFFDYPDSDQARLLAVAQFIGEKPIVFINSAGSSPGLFHHILVGFLVVAFFFLLFQFCTHIFPWECAGSAWLSVRRPGASQAPASTSRTKEQATRTPPAQLPGTHH
ncbi:fertilization-influencing membrane protein isoform X1 [Gorilla gorilla gorilla]|uniref:fertilization-influencing membrane protein isoform X1 n=1 Tax=Gorilla gorilla gorilla TaxID=9595 RepID=UPI002445E78C|nr:fertilization-influencing membrane protein isoform X2 [Gorilla gorilla gorilla]